MIQIQRSTTPPPILRTRGAALRRKLCRAYLRAPAAYQSGARIFDFNREVYGHDQVKAALRDAQHDKCAFCESKVTHVAYGDVEHFRPKAGFRQRATGPLERPGYYWLAYAWDNLLFACQLCNQRHKKNDFPLLDPSKRARSHQDALSHEEHELVDPAAEDPAQALSFREEVIFPRNRRGTATLKALGLTRGPLNERRKEHLDLMRANFVVGYALSPHEAALMPDEVQLARGVVRRALEDAGQFAAMVRAAVPRWEKKYGVRVR